MKIKISIPNDFGSEAAYKAAVAECYGGDEGPAADGGEAMYEVLANVAKAAGLIYESATDFGAIWEGTAEQCAKAEAALPDWAYVSAADDEE